MGAFLFMKPLLLTLILAAICTPQTARAIPFPSSQNSTAENPLTSSEVSAIRAKAEAGDPVAENAIGVMYRIGRGVAKDKEEAVHWYRKAAKHGNSAAMFNLGAAYYNGDGVAIDDVMSCAWFLLAEEAGYSEADAAVRRAASENSARITEASAKVAEMYESGNELPKDEFNALRWYRKAADGGAPEAAVKVAGMLLDGRNPSQAEYMEARKRCQDAADRQYSPGAYGMAIIYQRGLGVAKDPTEAAKWLIRAADLGHPKAMLQLAEAYWRGDGVKADLVAAYMWVWLAYNSNVPGSDRDEEALRKEMGQKDIGRAKKKADEWARQHGSLVLLRRSPGGTPPQQ